VNEGARPQVLPLDNVTQTLKNAGFRTYTSVVVENGENRHSPDPPPPEQPSPSVSILGFSVCIEGRVQLARYRWQCTDVNGKPSYVFTQNASSAKISGKV
jgi:hypothetical protein